MLVGQVESPQIRLLDKDYTKEEFDKCVDVLSGAFAHHPFTLALNDNDQELIRLSFASSLFDALPKSQVYVTGETDGRISTVMTARDPSLKVSEGASKDIDNPYRREYDGKLPDYLKEYMKTTFQDQFQKFVRDFGQEEWSDSWFVAEIGTSPDSQGHGLGTAILQFLFEKAAKQSKAVVLASWEKNTTLFYESLGFEVRCQNKVPMPRGGEAECWGLYYKH